MLERFGTFQIEMLRTFKAAMQVVSRRPDKQDLNHSDSQASNT